MTETPLLEIDLKLPSHYNELCKAEELIEKLKKRYEIIESQNNIDDCQHTLLFEETCRILLYVGKLSEAAFGVEDQLEAMYNNAFKHQPALAKQLWLQHYDEVHRPYSLLKNRCFRLLEALDENYFMVNKKLPPNSRI